MSTRENIGFGFRYESIYGYSRAVKIGNQVLVSGTTAVQADGSIVGVGNAYAQAIASLTTIERALNKGGADITDVVRTRVYLTNMDDIDAIAKAHHEVFGDIKPASTAVEVSGFTRPELLVEIEADAIIE